MIARLFRRRVTLGWVIAIGVLYIAVPTARSLAIGIPLAVVGLATRGLAAGTIRKGSELARSGPYAFTRNPLYLGSSVLALGFGIMSGNLIGAALLVIPSLRPGIRRLPERRSLLLPAPDQPPGARRVYIRSVRGQRRVQRHDRVSCGNRRFGDQVLPVVLNGTGRDLSRSSNRLRSLPAEPILFVQGPVSPERSILTEMWWLTGSGRKPTFLLWEWRSTWNGFGSSSGT